MFLKGTRSLDIGQMRPYINDADGKNYVSVFSGTPGADRKDEKNYITMQTNAKTILRRDEWKEIDLQVVAAAKARTGGVDDLIASGLVYRLANPLGKTALEWEDTNVPFEAETSMDAVARSRNDRITYQTNVTPLPITHVDYQLNLRTLTASRTLGEALDATNAYYAAYAVNLKIEQMLFADTIYTYGTPDSRNRNSIYSYVNFPDRTQVSMTSWIGKSPEDIIDDCLKMKQASIDAKHFGPWVMYIPVAYETLLDKDFNTVSGKTLRERILGIEGINTIRTNDILASDNVLLVQMTPDTVRLIEGFAPTTVSWDEQGGLLANFKVMALRVPQLRSDRNGLCGIVHAAV